MIRAAGRECVSGLMGRTYAIRVEKAFRRETRLLHRFWQYRVMLNPPLGRTPLRAIGERSVSPGGTAPTGSGGACSRVHVDPVVTGFVSNGEAIERSSPLLPAKGFARDRSPVGRSFGRHCHDEAAHHGERCAARCGCRYASGRNSVRQRAASVARSEASVATPSNQF